LTCLDCLRRDKAPRGALDIDEGHATNAGKLSPENMGEKSPLFLRQMIVGSAEGACVRDCMAQHRARRDIVKRSVPGDPRRQEFVSNRRQNDGPLLLVAVAGIHV
jgi:hypothetical protein